MENVNTKTQNSRMVTGIFDDREKAERAYDSVHARGYSTDDMNLMMSDETRKKHFAQKGESELGTKAAAGAGTGGAIGGTIGAIVGIVAAIGTSVLIPGLGLLVAGPLAAGLAGAGAGSVAGGLIGALVGSGIPEERARVYEKGIKEGKIVMSVTPRNDEDAKYFDNEWNSTHP